MPRPGRLVQGGNRRREPPAGDVRAREALEVEVDERVEEIEDDGADLHAEILATSRAAAMAR